MQDAEEARVVDATPGMYVPLASRNDDEPGADEQERRAASARAARSQPATGSHSMHARDPEVLAQRVEHLVAECAQLFELGLWIRWSRSPTPLASRTGSSGAARELAEAAVLPEGERQQRGREPERRTGGARAAVRASSSNAGATRKIEFDGLIAID